VEQGEPPFLRTPSFKRSSKSLRLHLRHVVGPVQRNTRPAQREVGTWYLERQGVVVAISTADQDVLGLKRALQLGVFITIIILAVVFWQQ